MLRDWWFARRLSALARHEDPVVRAYATAAWPSRRQPAAGAEFLALDFELDGLGRDAHLLQAGWTCMTAQSVALGTARRMDIRSDRHLNDMAVTVHGIGEQRARRGEELGHVANTLLSALTGRVLVAHGAAIELAALSRMADAVWQARVPFRSVCTMTLERKLHPGLGTADAYRLGQCRARYNLPGLNAHDALDDAIATAELFLAQLAYLPPDTRLATIEDAQITH